MSEKKSVGNNLKKASTYYLVGTFFNKGMSFLTVPIFTRLLTTYDYGIVNTYTSWSGIIGVIFSLAIYMGIRAAFIDYEDTIDEFVSVCNTFTIITSLIISSLVIFWGQIFNLNINMYLITFCFIEGFSDAILQNYMMYLMMKYKFRARTSIMVLPSLISTFVSVFLILTVFETNRYWGKIVSGSLIKTFFAVVALAICYSKSHKLFNFKYLSYALKISTPLVLHGIALGILSQSDRTMITWLAGASQTGIYSLIYNYSMIATVVTNALEGVWVPWFTQKLKYMEIDNINRAMSLYSFLICTIICGVMLVGPEVVSIMAAESYWEGIVVIPPLVISNFIIFVYTLFVNIEHYHKKTIFISVNTVIAAILNIVLNFVFIPQYGYAAAAYTTLMSYVTSLVLHLIYAKKLEKEVGKIRDFTKSFLLLIISVLVFYIFLTEWYIRWIFALIILMIMMHAERNIIFETLRKGKYKI